MMASSTAVCRQKHVRPRIAKANGHPRFTGRSVRSDGNKDKAAIPTRKRSARMASQRAGAGASNMANVRGIQRADGISINR